MIDSVTLLVPPQHFKITKPDEFTPSTDLVYNNRAVKAVLNPTAKELKTGIYKPRLTLSRRKNLQGVSEVMLTIELSLPKLMFGNNIEELQLKDFGAVTSKLQIILRDMGVEIALTHLQNADIIAVHYSKNIVLTDGSTPYHYIQKIKEIVAPTRLDHNHTNYRNSGQCFKYHCSAYEIVFYDKIFDLYQAKKSTKRSMDPVNFLDISHIEKLRSGRKKFEVLRMEVRLNKRSKIKQLFGALNIKSDLTLSKLFRPAIARKVLLHYVYVLEGKRSSLVNFKPLNDKQLLSTLVLHNPTLKPKQLLMFFGLKKALETITLDELKKSIVKQDIYNWNRLTQELNALKMPSTQKSFEIIYDQINAYKQLKIRKEL